MSRNSAALRTQTLVLAAVLTLPLVASAQDASAPATTQPATTQPAEDAAALYAEVLTVKGEALQGPVGATLDEMKPVKVGDRYPEKTQIRTGIRSKVELRIGSSAIAIDQIGYTIISEAYVREQENVERVKVDNLYGQVYGGSLPPSEGGRRSDLVIDSPAATLSKRGTEGFGLFYERYTGRFEVFLLDSGLVDVLNRVTLESRTIQPGELVNDAMRRWFDQVQIARNVPVADVLGQGEFNIAFNRLDNQGLGVLSPGTGRFVFIDLSANFARDSFFLQARDALSVLPQTGPFNAQLGGVIRPEGFFGTGRGDQLVQFVLDRGNDLVQKGAARPGRYLIRRDAVQNWVNNYQQTRR